METRTPTIKIKTKDTETALGIWNFSRNFTKGIITMAKSREIVNGTTTDEVIFRTAPKRMTVIIAIRKKITLPELKR
jgi:hypothetical protein